MPTAPLESVPFASATQALEAFMALGRLSPDLIHIHEPDTLRLIYANEQLEPMLGYGAAALDNLDGSLFSLLSERTQRLGVRAFVQTACNLPEGYAETHQMVVRHRNGSLRQLQTRVTLLPGENGPLLLCLTRDLTAEHQGEQKMRRLEMLLAETERLLKHGSWEWNMAANEVLWSEGIYRIFECDPSEPPFSREEYNALIDPAEQERITAISGEAIGAGRPFHYQTQVVLPTGRRKWISVRAKPVFDANGALTSLLGSTTDITAEHEQAQKQEFIQNLLSDSEEQFGYGSWIWQTDTDQIVWSRGLWLLLGFGPEAFTGRPQPPDWYFKYVHPDDAEIVRAATRQMLATGEYPPTYHRIVTVQGQVRTVLVRGRRQESDPPRIMGSLADVTQERDNMQRLIENEQFLSETEKVFHYGSWRYYIDSDTAHWSEGLLKMFGYEPGEFDGIALPRDMYLRHVHPDDREAIDRHALAVIASGAETYEDPYHRIVTKQGEVKIVKNRGKMMQAGRPGAYIIGSTIDFTHLKNLESELELKVRKLERSNAELEQFAYVASHDLQEPLRKLRAFGSLLLQENEASLSGNSRNYLDRMLTATGRMQQLITDLLTFSRMGRLHEDPVAVDLAAVLAQWLSDFELRIQEQQALVDIGPMPVVQAVGTQMQQLFQNLLGNALKFSKPGVPPHITVRSQPLAQADKQRHGLPALTSYAAITVADNGIGFEPEYTEKIFIIFQRLHGRSEYEGTGIGLAICKRIVDNHHGRIYARSQPGAGTIFTVILPE